MKTVQLLRLAGETSNDFVIACEDEGILDSVEFDMLVSAYACDIEPENIKESYSGKFSSDEDFVKDLLEQIGEMPDLPHYIYIDWERTTGSIMQGYVTDSDHYFRIH